MLSSIGVEDEKPIEHTWDDVLGEKDPAGFNFIVWAAHTVVRAFVGFFEECGDVFELIKDSYESETPILQQYWNKKIDNFKLVMVTAKALFETALEYVQGPAGSSNDQ